MGLGQLCVQRRGASVLTAPSPDMMRLAVSRAVINLVGACVRSAHDSLASGAPTAEEVREAQLAWNQLLGSGTARGALGLGPVGRVAGEPGRPEGLVLRPWRDRMRDEAAGGAASAASEGGDVLPAESPAQPAAKVARSRVARTCPVGSLVQPWHAVLWILANRQSRSIPGVPELENAARDAFNQIEDKDKQRSILDLASRLFRSGWGAREGGALLETAIANAGSELSLEPLLSVVAGKKAQGSKGASKGRSRSRSKGKS